MKQSQVSENEETVKAKAALLAVFPNTETYQDFKTENQTKTLESFIRYAKSKGLIPEETEKAFEDFISQNRQELPAGKSHTLKELQEKLKIESFRWLCGRIQMLITKCELKIPPVSPAMLSRMNKEPLNTDNKRNALRMIAFWIGHERTEFSISYNYIILSNCYPQDLNTAKIKEGAKLAISIQKRGENINESAIKWLRSELRSCISDLNISHALIENASSFDLTEFSVRIPIEGSMKRKFNHPRSYGKCIRDAVAIAHQIAVRWILSPHNSRKKFLSVGIASGEFSELDIQLKVLINAEIGSGSAHTDKKITN